MLPGLSRLSLAPFGFAARSRWRTAALVLMFTVSLVFVVPQAYAAVTAETQFILNSFSFLIWGALVMWMCAGFTMLEAGSVRTKNASVICLKNIGLYSIAGLTYYLVGYNLMYVDVGSWVGSFALPYSTSADEIALLGGDEAAAEGRRGGRLLHDVRLVLPDGVRGDDRLDRLRHPGRAREALVVLHLHHAC